MWGWGDIGGHEMEMGVLEIGALEGIKGGTNVKEGIDG